MKIVSLATPLPGLIRRLKLNTCPGKIIDVALGN
jgi:hypothetical protein